MTTKIEHALALAAKGFKVFPIKPNSKAPPLLAGWPERATSDSATIKEYWTPMPDANIGIHTAGYVVVDVDVKKGGDESLSALEMKYGLPNTLVARTPTGGRHIFFRHPFPVGNSVGALGSGLDIRSSGGYVVGVGSTVDSGTYIWDSQVPVDDCPPWLVDRLGSPVGKADTTVPVPDASDQVRERAQQWLASQLPAIEGCGGDAHTFKVACGLRDLGVSSVQALDLLGAWNATCAPPWTPDELSIKVANAYNYGQNVPGSKAALPSDFPVQEQPTFTKREQGAVRLSDFAASQTTGPGYLVKGLLQRRTYAELFGAPGEGKTFVALDIAYHVAASLAWMDRKVHGGTVLYLAYEGIGGLVKRAQALRRHYGDADVPLFVTGAAYSLRETAGRADLGRTMATLPDKPVLIIIDTFARALMGGDENSAQDVGAFNSAVAALIENTGACVMIVHHSGKNKAAGARGSSALLGAIDTELEVDGRQVTARKQRDIELTPPIGFNLLPVIVGMDEDGDELTSCVVGAATIVAHTATRLGGNQKRGFEVLCEIAPDNAPVAEYKWRDACLEFLGNKSVAQRFFDIKKALLAKGVIEQDVNGDILRRMA